MFPYFPQAAPSAKSAGAGGEPAPSRGHRGARHRITRHPQPLLPARRATGSAGQRTGSPVALPHSSVSPAPMSRVPRPGLEPATKPHGGPDLWNPRPVPRWIAARFPGGTAGRPSHQGSTFRDSGQRLPATAPHAPRQARRIPHPHAAPSRRRLVSPIQRRSSNRTDNQG